MRIVLKNTKSRAADYINKESKQIVALSHKLMDLMGLSDEHIAMGPISVPEKLKFITGDHVVWNMDKGMVIADSALIVSVLKNLCSNAEKAGASEIIISGSSNNNRYEIMVHDNGTGIAENDLSRIKEPFYMADRSRARANESAGLGLTLCEKILQLHGASLAIKSEVGVGTSVRFDLPLSQPVR